MNLRFDPSTILLYIAASVERYLRCHTSGSTSPIPRNEGMPEDLAEKFISPGTLNTLPVGISFYTFMAISYLLEVYKEVVVPANLLSFSTYLTMFPHLIAGPCRRRVNTPQIGRSKIPQVTQLSGL